ncbi:MAG TPA: carboxypeptidase-like regulatory domain-containing protein, partial [Actinomycetota bacterium]
MPTRKAFRVTVICVITGLLGAVTPAAHAALLTISGTVKTPAGSTIDGAIVSDGGQSDESGSDGIPGHYSLQELSFDTYRITASKQGMTSAVADVPLTATNSSATQDFTLFYQSTLQVPDPYLSTAQGPETLTATLRTWAPYPESCAKITDSRTGTVEAMTHVGVENGQQVWQYTPTLETGSTEGTFTLDGRVDDCSGSLIDTGAQPKTYFVDNSAPEIDLKSLVPAMLGHTIYSSQVIAATAIDHGSGVNPSSPILQIVQNGVQQNLDVSVSNISGGVRVRSEAALLTTGLIYTADLRISDRAGNQQHFSWDFKALEFGVEGTLARIETQGVPRGGDVWEFLPLLGVRSFNFQVGAPLHSGSGSAIQRVPLGAAVIEVAGVPVATPYDAGASADVLSGIDLFLGEPLSQQVKWQQVRLQPLSVSLPAGTESATLKLALSATTPVANTCMDPAVLPSGWLACSPDPFPFFVDEALAERMIQGKLQYFSKTGSALPGQGYVGALQRITRLDGYKVWQPVSLDGGVVSVAWEEQVISFIDGVGYFGTLDTWPV